MTIIYGKVQKISRRTLARTINVSFFVRGEQEEIDSTAFFSKRSLHVDLTLLILSSFFVDLVNHSHLVELLPAHVATDDAYHTIQSAQVDYTSSRQYRRALMLRLVTFVCVHIVTYMSRTY